jgi:D-tagatose-1,6-bisphosphate aldolase subunit GatZ/KbaZ
MKFCLGPMSKNIVDAVIDYSAKYGVEITFIPSRRQVDIHGGYVNNWTTREFCEYVFSKKVKTIQIQRDHGGPGQGYQDDDGIESLLEDAKYMNAIHIDPWKKYPVYDDALQSTVSLLETCAKANPNLYFEIGTEEGIRPLSLEALDQFCKDVKARVNPVVFERIRFLVIQCGTQLLEKENIGNFNEEKLSKMLAIAKSYGFTAKEHNGDWVSSDIILQKEKLGLQYINIAPELGELETKYILQHVKKNPDHFELFYKLCLESGRWKKWVSSEFEPEKNKETLILISGHYVFSHPDFVSMLSSYPDISSGIQKEIQRRLHEYFCVFTERKSCIFCHSTQLDTIHKEDKSIAMSYALLKEPNNGYFIPYNILHCQQCHTFQTKYIGDLEKVYSVNHIDNFGSVKSKMHEFFASFILENHSLINTAEIGACHDVLSRLLLQKNPRNNIHIIDPYFTGNTEGLTLVEDYIENIELSSLPVNALIMSSVFEHFYNPCSVLEQFQASQNIQYIYLNHPQLEFAIKNDIYINLTTEHTFYIEDGFLIDFFRKYGFEMTRSLSFENHTNCFEFTRKPTVTPPSLPVNKSSATDIKKYMKRLDQKIKNMNTFMDENPQYTYYVWPASMHLTPIFTHGFNTQKVKGLLDNSPNKIGKYFYGYNLPCYSFTEVVGNAGPNTCIFLGGSPNYRRELMLENRHCKFYEI